MSEHHQPREQPVRIAVVTGSRAEYGLLHPVMRRLRDHPGFDLRIVASCMHLSPAHGLTIREILDDGFVVDERVDMLLSTDSDLGVAKSMGLGTIGFADALTRLRPAAVMILGDRFEALAAACAATVLGLPILHLEGGHVTEGAIDDAMRHAITKLAHLHFTATEVYARRIRQMGERPERVLAVGSTAIDTIVSLKLLSRKELEDDLGFATGDPLFLVTFHPATLERGRSPQAQVDEMLHALGRFEDARVLITLPNADAGGHAIHDRLRWFAAQDPRRRRLVASLGRRRYLSALAAATVVIGNSSSGLIEAPSFRIPTVNIGERQKGRIRAASVIDCPAEAGAIEAAVRQALSPGFRAVAAQVVSPFGVGRAAERILAVLERTDFATLTSKGFFDLPLPSRDGGEKSLLTECPLAV
jgi:GDP/UDP-N,N'-diacetylbacillosamine 2-epimerase (hydrolysing)